MSCCCHRVVVRRRYHRRRRRRIFTPLRFYQQPARTPLRSHNIHPHGGDVLARVLWCASHSLGLLCMISSFIACAYYSPTCFSFLSFSHFLALSAANELTAPPWVAGSPSRHRCRSATDRLFRADILSSTKLHSLYRETPIKLYLLSSK